MAVITGTAGNDAFIGSAAVGQVEWRGGAGADTILGSGAIDRISYRDDVGAHGALVDLAAGLAFDVSGRSTIGWKLVYRSARGDLTVARYFIDDLRVEMK